MRKYPLFVRLPLAALVLAAAPLALGDRLITIPTARKLLDGTYRIESLRQFGSGANGTDYIAAGLGPSFEAEARILRSSYRDPRTTVDVTYNVISAIPGLSPGFAFGVQDAADQSRSGLRLFGCTTIRNEFEAGGTPLDITIGLFVGRRTSPFVGTTAPIAPWLRLLAEHDGVQGQVGLEATALRGFRLRVIGRDGDILGSVGYTTRF